MAIEFEKKVAVLVGVNKYDYVTPLQYARDDAVALADVLQKSLGFRPEDILTLVEGTEYPPTKSKIFYCLSEMRRQKKVKEDDLLLFFFSGHGQIGEEDGKDYLLPCDASVETLEQTGARIEEVAKELKKTGCKNIVMFIDACRNLGAKSAMSIGQEAADAVRRAGIVTFFSCDPKKYSYEIDALKHGAFTHCLLEAIEKGEGASVSALDSYLRKRVREINQSHQRPDQEPYAIIEPAEKGLLPIFLSSFHSVPAERSVVDWKNMLADLYTDGLIDLDLFNRTLEHLTTERSQATFDRDPRTNHIKLLYEKEMSLEAFIWAWRAYERKTSKPKPKTSL